MPARQLELAGLVELSGLLQVLDKLEQPRSTCHSTLHTVISPPIFLLGFQLTSLVLVCQASALVGGKVRAVLTKEPSSDVWVAIARHWRQPPFGTRWRTIRPLLEHNDELEQLGLELGQP